MPDEQDLAEGGHSPEATNTALLIPCVREETVNYFIRTRASC